MSYAQNHIEPGQKHQFSDPCLEDSTFFLTRKEIEARRAGFWGILERKAQDNSFDDLARSKLNKRDAASRWDFVCRIGYNRAIGSISRRDQISLYSGSSFNRKRPEKKCHHVADLTLEEKEILELETAYHDFKNATGYGLQKHDLKGEKLAAKNAAKKDKKNTMSKRTRQKVQDKMLAMYRACAGRKGYRKDKVAFTLCTLTFINDCADKKAMNLLDTFLQALRYRYGSLSYISVIERQDNGRPHFHILFDAKLPINYINSLWVKQQFEAGIIHKKAAKNAFKKYGKTFSQLHTEGKWKEVQEFLNPVDIDQVKTIDGISCYLTKYVTKNKGKFECRTWTCSTSISHLFTAQVVDWSRMAKTFDQTKNRIKSKAGWYKGKDGKKEYRPEREYISKPYFGQYCTINTLYNKKYYNYLVKDLEAINRYLLDLHQKEKYINPYQYREILLMDRPEFSRKYTDAIPAAWEIDKITVWN